jgi:hypothetical protein
MTDHASCTRSAWIDERTQCPRCAEPIAEAGRYKSSIVLRAELGRGALNVA